MASDNEGLALQLDTFKGTARVKSGGIKARE
jgi:hypothetical protein